MKRFSEFLIIFAALGLIAAGCTAQAPTNANTPAISTPAQQTVQYQGVEGKTALQLLKENYQVTTKNFDKLGEFVESINGITPDSKHFWAFYVNGQSSQVGAGQYQTKAGDNIEWKLDEINSYK